MYVFGFLPTVLAAAAISVAFLVGLLTGKRDLYPALTLPFGGACFWLVSDAGGRTAAFVGAYAAAGGGVYLLLCLFLAIRAARRRRKEARRAVERRLAFTLPDKENAFLRDRLNGPLKPLGRGASDFDPKEARLELSHARKLLDKVVAAKLSPADRLETLSVSRRLSACAERERLTGEEFAALNDCLLELLKTAAKYAV